MKKYRWLSALKRPVVWVPILSFLLIAYFVVSYMWPYRVEYPRTAEAVVKSAAEDLGLKDVAVEVGKLRKYEGTYSITYYYVADIYCSNFSELTPRQMLSVYDDLKEACGKVPRSGGIYVSTLCGDVFCGGHRYWVGSYLRTIRCDGVEIFDDYWNSQAHSDYLESNPEAAKSWKDQKAGLPYVGMPESRINSTILGKPSDVIRHNTAIKNGNRYTANLYDFVRNGKVIYTVRCVDGYVTETWDDRDSPASVPTYHTSSTKDDDPYDAASYSNEEDFYDDHYDDFFDYYDAEQYWRDHQE